MIVAPIERVKEEVVDMLQSLQTIQVESEDGEQVHRNQINSQNIEISDDDLGDSIPGFVIKPFEKSVDLVEADGQTAVKTFNGNGFEIDIDDQEESKSHQAQDHQTFVSAASYGRVANPIKPQEPIVSSHDNSDWDEGPLFVQD